MHLREKWVLLLFLLGALTQLVSGCGTTIETKSRRATGVDLSQYRTFDFAEAKHPSDLRFFSPTNEARIKAAVQTELEKRGLRRAHPAELEFCVYLKTTTRKYDRSHPPTGTGSVASDLRTYYGLLYDDSWGTQSVITYPQGTLVVHAVDVKQDRKVWEGIARAALHRNLPEKELEARIREAVAGMFRDFPER